MNPTIPPPDVAPLDEARLVARQAHLEREIARSDARTPRRRVVHGGILAAAGLAAVAFLLTGRGSQTDAVARALAAVSRGPYLGIVVHGNRGSSTLIHLDTRSTERVRAEAEIWFDTRKHGRAANIGGCTRLVGPSTRSGCIGWTFAFVDSTVITGSIDRYRNALATGRVHKTTSAIVRGRRAWWLRITPSSPLSRLMKQWVSYVAVDQKTGNPLRIETRKRGRVVNAQDIDVLAQTHRLPSYVLPLAQQLLPPPALAPGKKHQRGSTAATLAQASRTVPGALWPGRTAAGQPFRRARLITLDNGKKQLELLYGDACPKHCLLVKQGTESGWAPASRLYTALPDQSILVNGGRYADGRAGTIRIRIEGTSKAAVLATAQALQPLVP
ncbi:MAG: hypothetical protein QOH00_739 [Gaiellales bacterium]|jgi:hypothetical protein|nr:hypothetical protein [Gaiellales bacterium]